MRFIQQVFLLVLYSLLVAACASGNYAPVYDVYGGSSYRSNADRSKSIHVVSRGDTLYSIAWRYGWDYRALAKANKISYPYTIYPGQQIRVDGKTASTSRPASSTSSQPTRKPTASSSSKKPSSTSVSQSSTSKTPTSGSASLHWRWPTKGKVISSYRSSGVGKKGIGIAGQAGQPVIAAQAGRVVYRGSGLTGYGNLVIIKHNDRWLSAYAHNQKMFVKEGQNVKAGQKIATLGSSGADRDQLHFEIRRDGKPVDPLRYLPKK